MKLAFQLALCFCATLTAVNTAFAINAGIDARELDTDTRKSILDSGVPEASLDRILDYLKRNVGTEVTVDVYECEPAQANPVKPCIEEQRKKSSKKVAIVQPRYVAVIDFSLPSTEKRYFFIDLETGAVERFLTTHGKGSGNGPWAETFSNIKDSYQSSLGLYRTGEIYDGKYGDTIRLYGLESSNDQAYNRDIVMHGADYAREKFIESINPKTKKPFDRLGLSWGCPAVAPSVQKQLLPLIKDGSIIDLYHPELMDAAKGGKEVTVASPRN